MDLALIIWNVAASAYILFRILLVALNIHPTRYKDEKSKLSDAAWGVLWGIALALVIIFFALLIIGKNNIFPDVLPLSKTRETIVVIVSFINLSITGLIVMFGNS